MTVDGTTSGRRALTHGQRRYSRFRQLSLWLASALTACEPGATGDPCWSDWDCASSSCTFGTCDSEVVALLGVLLDVVSSSNRNSSSSSGDAESAPASTMHDGVACSALGEQECRQTPGCTYGSYCDPLPDCSSDRSAVDSCFACLTSAPCPRQCEEFGYCY